MRLDYPLYGLAIVSFILSAALFAVLGQQNGQLLYSASVAVLGLFFVVGGYFAKPKTQLSPSSQATSAPTVVAESMPSESPIVESQTTPTVETAPPIEPAKVETPNVEAPIATYTQPPTLVLPTSANVLPVEVTVPAQPIETAVPTAEPADTSDLKKIRGISENRASQLKENGIVTVADLAQASPADLAAKLQVSEKIVKMWIGSAKKLTK